MNSEEKHVRLIWPQISIAILVWAGQVIHAQTLFENFDQTGDTLANTLFPDTQLAGGGTFRRESLTSVSGAPSLSPPLTINAGGDLELRYFEAGAIAPVQSVALTAPNAANNYFEDGIIDGYIGYGIDTAFGDKQGGLILRAAGVNDYWVAYLSTFDGGLFIKRINGGIGLGGPYMLIPDLAAPNQVFHLQFSAIGENLTATVFSQSIQNGVVTESLIGTLTATDPSPAAGRAGLYAFVRGSNSVLFDNISVVVPEPAVGMLLPLGMALAFWRSHRN